MRIEFQFNSVQIDQQELQELFPALLAMDNSSLQQKKTPKRRKRKAKKTVGPLIQENNDSIDK
jgi:hypothetical protein